MTDSIINCQYCNQPCVKLKNPVGAKKDCYWNNCKQCNVRYLTTSQGNLLQCSFTKETEDGIYQLDLNYVANKTIIKFIKQESFKGPGVINKTYTYPNSVSRVVELNFCAKNISPENFKSKISTLINFS
jgi:hypothetical protein